jgi:hypothetical protein
VHGHGAMCGSSRLLLVVEAVGDNPPQVTKSSRPAHNALIKAMRCSVIALTLPASTGTAKGE